MGIRDKNMAPSEISNNIIAFRWKNRRDKGGLVSKNVKIGCLWRIFFVKGEQRFGAFASLQPCVQDTDGPLISSACFSREKKMANK